MPRCSKAPTLCPGTPADDGLRALLGPAPLLEGEDRRSYEALYARILHAVSPRDTLEEIWIHDVVNNLWESLRLRRLKVLALHAKSADGLKQLLAKLEGGYAYQYDDLAADWARGDREAIKSVNASLKSAGLPQEAIHAETLTANLETFERLDKMIMQLEARRNLILREIDRHRDVLAQRLRDVSRQIEDAEFSEIESPRDAAE